ncbi:hypothetical protein N2152v2_005192 [Parachlorella kessleri]
MSIRGMLIEHFGFEPANITLMLDTDPSTPQPTGANIKAKLKELVAMSKPSDALFFHFRTQIPDDGEEADKLDEAICPTDMNVICDDDLRAIFGPLDPRVKLTVIADCCHSGSLLDHGEVAISGPKAGEAMPSIGLSLLSGLMGRDVEVGGPAARDIKNRSLPTNQLLDFLSSKLGGSVGKGNIRSSMVSLFGNNASAKAVNYTQLAQQGMAAFKAAQQGNYASCMPFLKSLFAACSSGNAGGSAAPAAGATAPGVASGEPQLNVTHAAEPAGPRPPAKLREDVGVLITGCQAHETSADACPTGDATKAYGALSNAILTVVTAHSQQQPGTPLSSRTLVASVREALGKARFTQNPCLECSAANADSPFILH